MRKKKRNQYTAELIPLIIYKHDMLVGNGWFLVREDGQETKPILYNEYNQLLPEGMYTIQPLYESCYLVIVPERTQ